LTDAEFIRVGVVEDFPPGAMVGVRVGGQDVAVCRVGAQFHAISDFCTHEAVAFTSGYGVVIDDKVVCMLHTSIFDVETGEVLGGPAEDSLSKFTVKIEGNDVLISLQP
jgi:3-phenylpropionate/trans-cinnamate dioxygenase ferredoxin subunit